MEHTQANGTDYDEVGRTKKKIEENRADECDENGFGDGEEIYSDGCSQGRFEAFGQSIQVVKEEGGIE